MFSNTWNLNGVARAQKALVVMCGWGWNPGLLQALRLKLKARHMRSGRPGQEAKASVMFSRWLGLDPTLLLSASPSPYPPSHPISGPQEFNETCTGKGLTGTQQSSKQRKAWTARGGPE